MPRSFLSEEQKLELRLKDKEARRKRRQAPYRQEEQPSSSVQHSIPLQTRQVVVSTSQDDLRHRIDQLRSSIGKRQIVKVEQERASCSTTDEPLDLSHFSASRISSSVGNEHPLDLSLPSTSHRIVSFSSPSKQQVSVFDRLGSIDAPPIPPLASGHQSTHVQSEHSEDDTVLLIHLEESEAI